METITLGQLLKAVDGTLLGGFCDLNAPIGRVDTDSRSIHLGSLFVPLAGARFDGHAYLNSALEAGAAGCLTAQERDSLLPGNSTFGWPTPSGPCGTWRHGIGTNSPSPLSG